ncbi:hypothetical protein ABH944_007790 [Caballeronia udeis]|uniref:Right handed beta helix domain-containing protein n=1 Tax=Caballeronia udeis TaxID=1232866 RepID=A0ABW8MUS1_9BURK
MKKIIVFLIFLAVSFALPAQTFTVKNLQIGTTAASAPVYPTATSNAALMALPSTTASTITRLGFYAPGDAPTLVYTASGSPCSLNAGAGDNGSQVRSADSKCWIAVFPSGPVNVREWGAKGNGTFDDTAAFVGALATGKSVFAPDGNYQALDNNIVLNSGQSLLGSGWNTYVTSQFTGAGTIINCTNNSGHACIQVAAGATWVTIANMTINRSITPIGTAQAGSNGIQFASFSQFSNIHDVYIFNHFIGLVLHDASAGYVTNVVTQGNAADGLQMFNVSTGPMQWGLSNVLSQSNGGRGFYIYSTAAPGAGGVSVSNMDKIFSFGNSGVGFAVVGTAAQPIFGPRITNSFLGGDGNHEIFVQSFGGDVQITNSFLELSGSSDTGPLGTTPPTGAGNGIDIENGATIKISNNIINQMSANGIAINGGTGVSVTENLITNSGQNAATAGIGLYIGSGVTADVSGNTINNTAGYSSQQYGVLNAGTINVSIGNNLKPNTIGSFSGSAPTIGGSTLNNQ